MLALVDITWYTAGCCRRMLRLAEAYKESSKHVEKTDTKKTPFCD